MFFPAGGVASGSPAVGAAAFVALGEVGAGVGAVSVAALADSVATGAAGAGAAEGLGLGASGAGVVPLQAAANAIDDDRERAQSARGTEEAVFMVVSLHGCSPAGLHWRRDAVRRTPS